MSTIFTPGSAASSGTFGAATLCGQPEQDDVHPARRLGRRELLEDEVGRAPRGPGPRPRAARRRGRSTRRARARRRGGRGAGGSSPRRRSPEPPMTAARKRLPVPCAALIPGRARTLPARAPRGRAPEEPHGRRPRRRARLARGAARPRWRRSSRALVERNSFTGNAAGVDRVGRSTPSIAPRSARAGARRSSGSPSARFGPTSPSAAPAPGAPVFLVGHPDTVFPPGTFEGFRREGDRGIGPGVFDMKGGLVVMLFGLAAAARAGLLARVPLAGMLVVRRGGRLARVAAAPPRARPRRRLRARASSRAARATSSSRAARASPRSAPRRTASPRTPATSPRRGGARSGRSRGSSSARRRSPIPRAGCP